MTSSVKQMISDMRSKMKVICLEETRKWEATNIHQVKEKEPAKPVKSKATLRLEEMVNGDGFDFGHNYRKQAVLLLNQVAEWLGIENYEPLEIEPLLENSDELNVIKDTVIKPGVIVKVDYLLQLFLWNSVEYPSNFTSTTNQNKGLISETDWEVYPKELHVVTEGDIDLMVSRISGASLFKFFEKLEG